MENRSANAMEECCVEIKHREGSLNLGLCVVPSQCPLLLLWMM